MSTHKIKPDGTLWAFAEACAKKKVHIRVSENYSLPTKGKRAQIQMTKNTFIDNCNAASLRMKWIQMSTKQIALPGIVEAFQITHLISKLGILRPRSPLNIINLTIPRRFSDVFILAGARHFLILFPKASNTYPQKLAPNTSQHVQHES